MRILPTSWHLYSQELSSPDAGPLPTEFAFDVNENIELIGKVTEDKRQNAFGYG